MLKRKILDRLIEWKERSKGTTALMIDGTRRVGKSYIVEEFAKKHYRSYILIDFYLEQKVVRDIFENEITNLDNFFLLLQSYFHVDLYERESLIIFDEVQTFPWARSMIKYLVKDGRYDYIETGSLLSIKKNTKDIMIPSEEEKIKMFPLDFEEFLWAMGENRMMDYVRQCYARREPLGQAMHRKIMMMFRQYLIVGGMPQVVEKFVTTKNLKEVDIVKRTILELYRDDIIKHAGNDADKAMKVFDYIPAQLQAQNKRFQIADADGAESARFRNYESALFWLGEAMTVNFCHNTTEPTVGLKSREDRSDFKCYMGDTGLLISHTFSESELMVDEIYNKLLLDKLEFNNGFVVENVVAQMLRAAGHELFYYANSNRENAAERMEIDFLLAKSKITSRHNITALEVKSSNGYSIISLKKFMDKFKEQLNVPIVLHPGDVGEKDGILYLPLYMTGLL
ncbi:ATP-binding protein [Candidatus Saccharibacteria bacterium]|nr:ATP-binding protein [Candidatus Saccharibacteria bacterium]